MQRIARVATAALASALLGACASTSTVVLLPEKDGHPSELTVRQGEREVVLAQPYAAAKSTPLGPREYRSGPDEVSSRFGPALAAQPSRPSSFTVYFVEGKDELTEESKRDIDSILLEIAKRPVPDVLVVGHTDAVGTDAFNDALGQQRAEFVRRALIGLRVPADDVHAISRGKRQLAVPTPDGVAEPRNRRVEIIVR